MACLYGTMRDITRQSELDTQKQQLCAEMQGRLLFMDHPVSGWIKEIVSCDMMMPVASVAKLMTGYDTDIVLVCSATGEYLGMITDVDIFRRVTASTISHDRPVFEFMNAPLISIDTQESLSRAVVLMQEKSVEHLCVKDTDDRICGTVRKGDLINLQHNTGVVLTTAIENASTVAELRNIYRRLPLYVNALSQAGARTSIITGAITTTSDAISTKLEKLIIRDLGAPPVPFAFVALGSEGRCEQTLLTDQDNAIIYLDAEEDKKDQAREYFAKYGLKMCDLLMK
jgi:CBS domain-containing protein